MNPGSIYHIYSHVNGFEVLYKEASDYQSFLEKFTRHTSAVSKIYAYCLMTNHFHFLMEMRSDKEILQRFPGANAEKKISKAFSNALSGYAQKFNRKYSRMGSLFMQNFGRREIYTENDFCSTCHYIHANPVHHGFTDSLEKWPYSSYKAILNGTLDWIDSATVLDYFGSKKEYIKYHQQEIQLKIKEKVYF
jgi:REP element-mobilizing transposase RayT